MELCEPRKKHKVRLQPQQTLPLIFNEDGDLIIFTAHLNALGTCIAEPDDMSAVHSMGFFGKGSLSRSYPTFGRARYGAPPVIRERQWLRRIKWVEEVKQLSLEFRTENEKEISVAEEIDFQNQPSTSGLCGKTFKPSGSNNSQSQDSSQFMDGIEIVADKNFEFREYRKRFSDKEIEILEETNIEPPAKHSKLTNAEVDEIVLDSMEDEEIIEISEEEFNKKCGDRRNDSCQREELDPLSEDESDVINHGKVLILPDSDSETEDYLRDIKPRVEDDGFPVKETLQLTFEETFFLMFALGCLKVMDFQGKILSISEAWDHFCREDVFFIQKYVVYHYFRSKGWVAKPGLKYGGDFLLYKQGPPFYHASYIVLVDVLDTTLKRIKEKAMRSMKLTDFIGMERLSESAAKEILLAQVIWPDTIPKDNYSLVLEKLSDFTVKEVLMRRWRISKRPTASTSAQSEDDEDST